MAATAFCTTAMYCSMLAVDDIDFSQAELARSQIATNLALAMCWCSRHLILTVAVLADHPLLMRCTLFFGAFLLCIDAIFASWRGFGYEVLPRDWWGAFPAASEAIFVVNDLGCAIMILATMLFASVLSMLKSYWRIIAVCCFVDLSLQLCHGIIAAVVAKNFHCAWIWAAADILTLLLLARPAATQKFQAFLMRTLKDHGARAAASGIAAFLGDCSAEQAYSQAQVGFRSLCLDQVDWQDMQSNVPDASLITVTKAIELGQCDAFVSHSWHDNADAKWSALQTWRREFVQTNGREAEIWLDKYCIDQTDIEASLRCLPVFLSGCSKLVILCGETYLSRLWCITELFVFIHMGGDPKKIELIPVFATENQQDEYAAILRGISNFNASKCKCSQRQDLIKILGVILAAFGSFDEFNLVVKRILSDLFPVGATERLGTTRESDSDTEMPV